MNGKVDMSSAVAFALRMGCRGICFLSLQVSTSARGSLDPPTRPRLQL